MSKQNRLTSRRAVAPVIATLLLVAIAVVGGSIVFVFSQGFFSSAQISGTPSIESLKILGYDARDALDLTMHDGQKVLDLAGTNSTNGLQAGERIAVYLKNDSVQKVTLSEVRFAGEVYTFATAVGGTLTTGTGGTDGAFQIATKGTATGGLDSTSAEIQPGQQASVVLQLKDTIKSGRDAQFKLSTSNGAVFVGTVVAGQQSG